ncbi:hypothetical protein LCGC14_1082090 [marine sediment metagenome]|uniref:Histidine kinase domain-containing protein n=1 Tax=marine sediment metagenome TaxID=412755 RepID=A0A0F9MJM3_9ZZZZ|nr:hypothetical protein [Candidatus Aminicenantes bacterium]HEB34776.1 hypothetical protein [Candidatus Aminicenantes bacterium]
MNKLLQRQIKKFTRGSDSLHEEIKPLLYGISDAYDSFDIDRSLIERSLDLSSKELTDANKRLRQEAEKHKAIIDKLKSILTSLAPDLNHFSKESSKDDATYFINFISKLIDERKNTEKALKNAYKKLKDTQNELIQVEKLKVIGRLASGVSHEVKNPLAMILLGVQYLRKKIKSKDRKVVLTLKHMEKAIERADKIIKGLLDFASLSKLDIKQENLNSIVEESLRLVKIQFDKNCIRVETDLKENIPKVKIDKNKIEQVFINIFMNSSHAMHDGGQLTVRTYSKKLKKPGKDGDRRQNDLFKPGETMVISEIADTGPGIPKNILDKIFDPFFTTTRDKGGTGLGLSIVRNIIQMHYGKIEIKNNAKGGIKSTLFFKV